MQKKVTEKMERRFDEIDDSIISTESSQTDEKGLLKSKGARTRKQKTNNSRKDAARTSQDLTVLAEKVEHVSQVVSYKRRVGWWIKSRFRTFYNNHVTVVHPLKSCPLKSLEIRWRHQVWQDVGR